LGGGVTLNDLYLVSGRAFEWGGGVWVGAGAEHTFFTMLPEMAVDVSDNQVRATEILPGGFTFQSASFNGVRLTFSGAPMIMDVTLNGSSATTFANLSFNDNQIFLDMSNITWMQGDFTLLDVTFCGAVGVPMPAAAWAGMVLVGGMGVVRFVRRRRM